MKNQFPKNVKWFKGNLHSHTTNSDGTLTPEEAAEIYHREGYSFLCLSDHDLYTDYRAELGAEDFLILPGAEICAVLFDEKDECVKLHHMNGILGTEKMQKEAPDQTFCHMERIEPDIYYGSWNGRRAAEKMAERLHRHGCIVTYNHPIWSRVEKEEFSLENAYESLEIYNYNTVNESGTGYDVTYWDQMLRKGIHMNADAADDNHNGSFPDNFGGFIMVGAKALTHEDIVTALIRGEYYSSSGPLIYDYEIHENVLEISCSPVERINIVAGGPVGNGTTIMAEPGKSIERASFPFNGTESYVRVECIDQFGKTAWTNPYYFD